MRIRKKCVQAVTPKPAKLLKSLMQFGMSVKCVVFDFGRLCRFGIGIMFLGFFHLLVSESYLLHKPDL